jgi:hypothetical protein
VKHVLNLKKKFSLTELIKKKFIQSRAFIMKGEQKLVVLNTGTVYMCKRITITFVASVESDHRLW